MTWREAHQRRLARQFLIAPAATDELVGVVGAVCGVQAQIMSAAELGIGLRVAGITQRTVRQELWQRCRLVKTYGPRGTLHLLPAAELPLWMAAMRANPTERIFAEFDPPQVETLVEAIGAALDGRQLTRQELVDAVVERVGEWPREKLSSNWGELLTPAAYAGRLCFGPSRGTNVTFVRPDQWLGPMDEINSDYALREVLRRYLAAYGPASHREFARWFHLKPAQARALIESIADELAEVDVEGWRAWLPAGDADIPPAPADGSLRLLPHYDCYLLGCGPRERIVPEAARARISSYGRGRYEGVVALPTLLIDGAVAGIWERRRRGSRLEIRVELFQRLTSVQCDQLEAEVARVGGFLEIETSLTIGALS